MNVFIHCHAFRVRRTRTIASTGKEINHLRPKHGFVCALPTPPQAPAFLHAQQSISRSFSQLACCGWTSDGMVRRHGYEQTAQPSEPHTFGIFSTPPLQPAHNVGQVQGRRWQQHGDGAVRRIPSNLARSASSPMRPNPASCIRARHCAIAPSERTR